MNIEIKRLSPELTDDYIDFFDNIAFTDNPEWSGCYCVWYHWNEYLDNECKTYEVSGGTRFRRGLAIRYIKEGNLQGYLAYVDGTVAGFCNTNDKGNYEGLGKAKLPDIMEDTDETTKIKSVVCFTIAPNMRCKGIATQLLKRVCEDAKSDGYNFVEAYPEIGEINNRSYHGPYSIYEKNGFIIQKDLGSVVIVRKYL